MKISVELDKKKIAVAKKLSGTSSISKLLDMVLDIYISNARRQKMLKLLGTDFFVGDLSAMRRNRF